jgi:tRNA 2-thiocytidine biosynthesis protein TtcA
MDKPVVNKKMKLTDTFEYYLLKKVGKTVKKYGMIERGDRILVGVSGGKDSFSLLKILHDRKGFYPHSYDILALHVASDMPCEGLADTGVLEEYLKGHGYPFEVVRQRIRTGERGFNPFWCARNRRRVLFDTARRLGYNKIALGHHRNDVIETFLLNMFYHAELSTMLPVQHLFDGKMTIIRPLYNIPEADTRKLAGLYGFPAVHCRCPFEGETSREMMGRWIREVERMNPKSGVNAQRAFENVREDYLPSRAIKEDISI